MGFTTGFLGGFTLTASVLYLTLSLHQQNRATQASMLRQQRLVLTGLVGEKRSVPEPEARELPVGLAEMAKDRWNREVETLVKKVQTTDWRRERERAEDWVSTLFSGVGK